MNDPLFDTLFRSTASGAPGLSGPAVRTSPIASAPPVRERGTRTRAGNAMSRTRSALMAGAAQAVEDTGTKITMAQVAAAAGVAKATLYNHFRTREAVLDALLQHQVQTLCDDLAGRPLADALSAAATAISASPVLRALARREPATVATLGRIDRRSTGWRTARAAVETALAASGRGGADFVLRWLASYLVSPARPAEIAADLAVLIAALPDAPPAQVAETA